MIFAFASELILTHPLHKNRGGTPQNAKRPPAVVRTDRHEPQEPNIVRLQHIAALVRALDVSLQNLGEGHPQVINLRQRISRLQHGIPATGASITSTNFATPEVIERNNKIAELTMNLKETSDDDEKEAIKSELQSELEAQYDSYLEQHEAPLIQLEERLAKLRKDFESRKNAKSDLVKLRLDTIWYETQGLGWPNQNSNIPVQRVSRPSSNGFGNSHFGSALPPTSRSRNSPPFGKTNQARQQFQQLENDRPAAPKEFYDFESTRDRRKER